MSEVRVPAQKGDHDSWLIELYHARCGTKITISPRVIGKYCYRCNEHWRINVLDAFTDDQMAIRFYKTVAQDNGEYVLVEMADDADRRGFLSLVPKSEAHKHKRFTP